MVIDPKLRQHLAHWGIHMDELKKTEQTMMEQEVELNANYDWSKMVSINTEKMTGQLGKLVYSPIVSLHIPTTPLLT